MIVTKKTTVHIEVSDYTAQVLYRALYEIYNNERQILDDESDSDLAMESIKSLCRAIGEEML